MNSASQEAPAYWHALDVKHASDIDVNVGEMLVSQFDCGERVFEIADHLVCSAFDLVEVDSVAAWPGRRGEGRL